MTILNSNVTILLYDNYKKNTLYGLLVKNTFPNFKKFIRDFIKNPENPSADLYSILYQLESFRTPEGFHFKICYPELNGCNLWIQTSNPAQEWNIEGFQKVHLSFQDNGNNTNWTGLGKNKYGG